MSIVLVIGPDAKSIKVQLESIKSLSCVAVDGIADAINPINKDQFDFVICDVKLEDDKRTFQAECRKKQPFLKFYYIVNSPPEEGGINVVDADGILRRPVKQESLNDIVGSEGLLDQNDVDELFG